MNRDLVDFLVCPGCRCDLQLGAAGDGGVIRTGVLDCPGCDRSYPIRAGVPRFEDDREPTATMQHFEVEFSETADGDRDIDETPLLEFIFNSRTGLDPGALAERADWYPTSVPTGYQPDWSAVTGRAVLEGGCGPGRFLPLLAMRARRVVGLELGSHVDRAAARCAHLKNVDLVQGSVLRPPFRNASFDVVYSIGVLHHTPDPRTGACALGALAGPGGRLSVWVYGRDYWGRGIQRPIGKAIHARMVRLGPSASHSFAKRRLMPIGRLQARLARRRWSKLLAAPLFAVRIPRHPVPEVMLATIFDYFGAPIISTHDDAEVRAWLAGAGFDQVHSLPVPTSVQAVRGSG